jgi:hypothetical protein
MAMAVSSGRDGVLLRRGATLENLRHVFLWTRGGEGLVSQWCLTGISVNVRASAHPIKRIRLGENPAKEKGTPNGVPLHDLLHGAIVRSGGSGRRWGLFGNGTQG